MTKSPIERDAYLQAEVTTALAHQIRAIRIQRGWSQAELARRMGTKQHVVSRLENPDYGRYTLQTLMMLSRAFDTGLQVRFVSFVTMLKDTLRPKHQERLVPSFEEEAPHVAFYSSKTSAPLLVINQVSSDPAMAPCFEKVIAQSTGSTGLWINVLGSRTSAIQPISD